MYQNIRELPTQVISALSDDDARSWMNVYNETLAAMDEPSEGDILAARRDAWYSVKDSPSSYSFCAKATVEAVDKQGELVDLQSVKDLMDDYIAHSGPMSWDHTNYTVGTVWGWESIDTDDGPGIAVWGNLFKGDDPIYMTVRKAFAKGANKLSVAGDASKEDRTCDSEHGCYIRRKMRQLMEIAITPHPVNRYATMLWSNDNLAKSERRDEPMLTLDMKDMMIHRSEEDCPIMQMRNALRKAGIDAHARVDGVHILMDPSKASWLSEKTGLKMIPTASDILIPNPENVFEDEFKKSFRAGEITSDGYLTLDMSEGRFKELWNLGFLEMDENRFRFAYN